MHKYYSIVNNIDLVHGDQTRFIRRKPHCRSEKGLLIVTII